MNRPRRIPCSVYLWSERQRHWNVVFFTRTRWGAKRMKKRLEDEAIRHGLMANVKITEVWWRFHTREEIAVQDGVLPDDLSVVSFEGD